MHILSHRGNWNKSGEKNTKLAFLRSFEAGFGTETDIRDQGGRVVISHDLPTPKAITFSAFAALPGAANVPLALNVKADGLAALVRAEIEEADLRSAFAFDMSVPDMQSYFTAGIPVMTRMSEVEQEPAWLQRSAGVWLDGFESNWWSTDTIHRILDRGKRVCIVSPELHGREHLAAWETLLEFSAADAVLLCTDFPLEARNVLEIKE